MRARWMVAVATAALVCSGCVTVLHSSITDDHNPMQFGDVLDVAQPISADGHFVLFIAERTDTPGSGRLLWRRDNRDDSTIVVSTGNTSAPVPVTQGAISGSGRYASFVTTASLEPDDVNGGSDAGQDVYFKDLVTGVVTLESIRPDGSHFASDATEHLDDAVLMSDDGRYLAFENRRQPGGTADIYVRDRTTGTTTEVVHDTLDGVSNISGDGLHLALSARAVTGHAWIVDWTKHTARQLEPCSSVAGLSRTGRYVLINTIAVSDGCAGAVYRLDRRDGSRLNVGPPDRAPGTNFFVGSGISGDGSTVTFETDGAFAAGDRNNEPDVYAQDLVRGGTSIVSTDAFGRPGPPRVRGEEDHLGSYGTVSADGLWVAVRSDYRLTPSDTDDDVDLFTTRAVRPLIGGVGPAAARGSSGLVVTVQGIGFARDAFPSFGAGVTVTDVDVRSGSTLLATVSVANDATRGPRDVTVTNPASLGSASGVCHGCLTIT